MAEILKWDRFEYEVKPFNLGTLYDLWERISEAANNGKVLSGSFDAACQALLKGASKEAQAYLNNGSLVASILGCEDIEKAIGFKDRVDFFSTSYSERGQKLKKSAPDLTDRLEAKEPQAQTRKSRQASKDDSAHSG